MRHVSKLFPSKYLTADDLLDGDINATIIRVLDEVEVGDDKRPVLELDGCKDVVLNKTNATTIGELYGGDLDQWPGKQITLYRGDTLYMGQPKKCIRVRSSQATVNRAVDLPINSVNGAKLDSNQQNILKNLYTNNQWPTEAVERLVKEVVGAGVSSLGQIGTEHFQALAAHFGKAFKAEDSEELNASSIPF